MPRRPPSARHWHYVGRMMGWDELGKKEQYKKLQISQSMDFYLSGSILAAFCQGDYDAVLLFIILGRVSTEWSSINIFPIIPFHP